MFRCKHFDSARQVTCLVGNDGLYLEYCDQCAIDLLDFILGELDGKTASTLVRKHRADNGNRKVE